MSRLVVLGVGGMGREAAAWIGDTKRADDLVGFVDDDPMAHDTEVAGLPVLGGLRWVLAQDDVELVVALGNPGVRARVLAELARRGVPTATIVHPTAVVGPRTTLGDASIVCPGAVVTCDVTLGEGVIVNYGALVGHDCEVGRAAFLAPGVHVAGNVRIGEEADVGIGASVIQGVTIGDRAVVGAGAVVVRDVPADTTVVGVPARPLHGAGGLGLRERGAH